MNNQLLSKILDYEVLKTFSSGNTIIIIPTEKLVDDNFDPIDNKYLLSKNDLAMRAKEWIEKNYREHYIWNIDTGSYVNPGSEVSYMPYAIVTLYNAQSVEFTGNTEAEAIIKMCEWCFVNLNHEFLVEMTKEGKW